MEYFRRRWRNRHRKRLGEHNQTPQPSIAANHAAPSTPRSLLVRHCSSRDLQLSSEQVSVLLHIYGDLAQLYAIGASNALSGKVADDGEGEYERLTSGSEFGEFTGSCPSTRPYALCCYSVSLTSLGGGKVIIGLSGVMLIVHLCAVATGGVSVQRPDPEILHRHPNPGLLSRMDFNENWMLAKWAAKSLALLLGSLSVLW